MKLTTLLLLIGILLVIPLLSASNCRARLKMTRTSCNRNGQIFIQFNCHDIFNRKVAIRWGRQSKSLPVDAKSYASATVSQLIMYDMQRNDEGVYYCEAVECDPTVQPHRAEIQIEFEKLRVQAKACNSHDSTSEQNPIDTGNAKSETKLQIIQRLNEDHGKLNVILHCRDPHKLIVKVHWRRHDNRLLSEFARVHVSLHPSHSELAIYDMQRDEEGIYYCETSDTDPSVEGHRAEIQLNLEELRRKPCDDKISLTITHDFGEINGELYVRLVCRDAKGQGVRVDWGRRNGILSERVSVLPIQGFGQMNIRKMQQDDDGVYYCKTVESDHSAVGHWAEIQLNFQELRRKAHEDLIPSTTLAPVTEPKITPYEISLTITHRFSEDDKGIFVVLTCQDAKDQHVRVKWGRYNEKLSERVRVSDSEMAQGYSQLDIEGMQQNDDGVYYCETVGRGPSAKAHWAEFELNLEKITKEIREDEISLTMTHQFSEDNGEVSVVLTCQDKKGQYVRVDWGRYVEEPSERMRVFYPEMAQGYSQMEIIPMQQTDNGIYYCETAESDPLVEGHWANIELNLEEIKKEIRDDKIDLTINHRFIEKDGEAYIVLGCGVAKGQNVEVNWRRHNNEPLPHNKRISSIHGYSYMEIFNMQQNDEGVYYCETAQSNPSAKGHRAEIELTLTEVMREAREAPSQDLDEVDPVMNVAGLSVSPGSHVAEEYDIVTVICQRNPGSAKNLRWLREDNKAFSLTAVRDNGNLTIYGVESEDAGNYFCEYIDEESGQIERVEYTLRVKDFGTIEDEDPCCPVDTCKQPEKPLLNSEYPGSGGDFETARKRDYKLKIRPKTLLVEEHSNVTLSCYNEDHLPVPVYWRLRDGGSIPSRVIISNGLITFPNFQPADAGFYVCQVAGTSLPEEGGRAEILISMEKAEE